MLIGVVSAKGAPGVTATALALTLTWPRVSLLAECDPRGGDVLAGYGAAQHPAGRGLLELQIRGRNGSLSDELWGQAVRLPDGSGNHFLLPGLESAQQARAVNWVSMASMFRQLDLIQVDVIADCGEVHAQNAPQPVLRTADLVVLVTRPTMPALRASLRTASVLQDDLQRHGMGSDRLAVVVVDAKNGYSTQEISRQFSRYEIPVIGTLPWHERTARVLSEGRDSSNSYLHSPLMKVAAALARDVGTRALAHRNELETMQQAAHPPSNGHHVAMTGQGERHEY